MTYRVVITARPVTTSRSIPRPIAVRIGEELAALAGEADPKRHLKKLKGSDNPAFYSLRVGDYRTILSVIDDLLVIHVVAVGPSGGSDIAWDTVSPFRVRATIGSPGEPILLSTKPTRD